MTVLVPVRYPLNDANRRAIRKGRHLVAADPNPELVVVHVNRLHRDEHVDRSVDLEVFLADQLDAEVHVVPDAG